MGLDTTHEAFHGSYSGFNDWRKAVASTIGIELEKMSGFQVARWGYKEGDNAIQWESLDQRPLLELLSHSDCDGEISWENCGPLADDLESILPALADISDTWHNHHDRAEQFIAGLRLAYSQKENLVFM